MQRLRLWLLTVGMTLLIWVAADQRVTRSAELKLPFSIKPAVPGAMAVQLVDPDVKFIKIEFRGPSRAIAELKSVQDSLAAELQVSERDSGRYELNLLNELRAQMDQFPGGLVIVSTYPPTVTVDADPYVERQVRLSVDASSYQFEGTPQLDPAEVTVRVPQGRFDQLSADQRRITIPVTGLPGGEWEEGRAIEKLIVVPRELGGGLTALHVEPESVTLRATPLKRIRTDRIPTVIIRVLPATPSLFDRHRLVFVEQPESEFVTRPVVVRGPVDLMSDLIDNLSKYALAGIIHINREDVREGKPSGPIPKEVHIINLPKGVELAEKPEVVYVELVPRS